MKTTFYLICLIVACMLGGCQEDREEMPPSNLRAIQYFRFQPYHNEGQFLTTFTGSIDETNKRITVKLPATVDLTALRPQIVLSPWTTVHPQSLEAVDFSQGPVEYTVTAESGKTAVYEVVIDPTFKFSGAIMFGVWVNNIIDPLTNMPLRSTFSSSTGRNYDIKLPVNSPYDALELEFENDQNSFNCTVEMSSQGDSGPWVPFASPVDFSQNPDRRMWFRFTSENGSTINVYQLTVTFD